MHFVHDTHVLAYSVVFFPEESILLLKFDVPIEETPGLFVGSGLTETWLSLR